MRKFLTITLMFLACNIATLSQETDYHPLVREGVKWVNHSSIGGEDYFSESTPYVLEFHGDTVISVTGNPFEYKRCYQYDISQKGCVDFNELSPIAFFREVDGVVYMIDAEWPEREFVRYDFSSVADKTMLYNEDGGDYSTDTCDLDGTTDVQGKICRVYHGNLGMIVESVGLVSQSMGDMVHPKWHQVAGFDRYCGLDYMEDANGAIIYKTPWYQEPAEYHPLVREGVVWHYSYGAFVDGFVKEDIKMQFKGDSILNGIEYKKCYFYKEAEIPEGSQPLCLAREEDKKVMFCGFSHEVMDTLGTATDYLPGLPNGQNENGEWIVYDFGDMTTFIEQIGGEFEDVQVQSISEVDVNGHNAKSYHISGMGIFDADLIEGVGVDGEGTGFLFGPLTIRTTCVCSMPFGLIMVEDLDGNVLYKGVRYDDFYSGVDQVRGKGLSLTVEQSETSLRISLPSAGMLSVIDMAGHTAINRMAERGSCNLPLSSLAPGVYVVQLATSAAATATKVVIK